MQSLSLRRTLAQTWGTNEGEMCYDWVRAVANVNASAEICCECRTISQAAERADTLALGTITNSTFFPLSFHCLLPPFTFSSHLLPTKCVITPTVRLSCTCLHRLPCFSFFFGVFIHDSCLLALHHLCLPKRWEVFAKATQIN